MQRGKNLNRWEMRLHSTSNDKSDGQMAPHLNDIANALRQEEYSGSISFESVYRPLGGTFEDDYRASLNAFKEIFGA